jgi:putative ABC transport system permease protein
LRKLLLVSQVALTLMLLVGAGLMIRTFVALRAIDPGFDPRHVLSLVVSVTGSPEAAPGRRATFFPQLVGRIESLPGVESASAINHLPLAGDLWGLSYWVEGRPIPPPGEAARAAYRVVLPGYFRTMNIPVGRGRDIAAPDGAGTSSVVVINEHLAKEQWPGEDPIGKRITMDDPSDPSSWMTVVGVVKDARQLRWADPIGNEVYLPYLQSPKYLDDISPARTYLTLVVRTVGDPAAIAPAVRREIAALDPSVVVSQVQTMETVVAEANAQARLYLILLAAFAGVALVLAVVGIYGVMSYAVSRRTQEIGIRMALGAQRGEVLRMIVGQGLTLALIGAAVGVVGALALTRLMTTLLYGVTAIDPITFVVVALFLSAVALVATYLPARRATQVDPMLALRGD